MGFTIERRVESVRLRFDAGDRMTWDDWAGVLEIIALFISMFDEVSMSLKLEVVGPPRVELGSGYIHYVE